MQNRITAIAAVLLVFSTAGTASAQTARPAVIDSIVASAKAAGGIASVVCPPGAEDLVVPLALALPSGVYVHAVVSPEACPGVRERVLEADLPARVAVSAMDADRRLPYATELLNVLAVAGAGNSGWSAAETLRVLAPLGRGFVEVDSGSAADQFAEALRGAGAADVEALPGGAGWLTFRKPWPEDMGEWSHGLHGPDNNPVAPDLRVGPPKQLQWTAGPRWPRNHESAGSLPTMVSAAGRLFAAVDEGPIGISAENVPDKWMLIARDAFNGRVLWKRPIGDWGWRSWREDKFTRVVPPAMARGLVATGKRIVVTDGFRGEVLILDALTGKLIRRCAETKGTDELVLSDQVLFTVQQTGDTPTPSSMHQYDGEVGNQMQRIRAMSLTDGHVLWEREATCQPQTLCTSGSGVFWWDDGVVVAHDRASGMRLWTSGKLGEGNYHSLIAADGVVLAANNEVHGTLTALDAATGNQLWQTRQRAGYFTTPPEMFVIDGTVWADGYFDEWLPSYRQANEHMPSYRFPTMMRVAGRDLRTGKLVREIDTGGMFKTGHHHRCYPLKATSRFIMASRRGTEFIDLQGEDFSVNNWVRSSCQLGFMPANGLLYATPHPCHCYISVQLTGLNALAPERGVEWGAENEERFRRGQAYGETSHPNSKAADPQDWPAYRYDAARSGATPGVVPPKLREVWSAPVGGKLTQPVVVGSTVLVAQVDTGTLNAYDSESGQRRWRFNAGGRIDSAPSVADGLVLLGCNDGWLYCLRLSDGAMVWQRRLAPDDVLIGDHGQLASAWPVHGAALATDGVVYAAAGRASVLDGGITVYALDAYTGALRHQTKVIHTSVEDPRKMVGNNQGSMSGNLNDVMLREGDSIFMRHAKFDLGLKNQSRSIESAARMLTWAKPMKVYGTPNDVAHLVAASGILDGTMFNRMSWVRGDAAGQLIVWNESVTCTLTKFHTPKRNLISPLFFPDTEGVLIAGRKTLSSAPNPAEVLYEPVSDESLWQMRVPVRVEAMLLAGDILFIAGQPDRIDPDDPLGSFEGRKGGQLIAIDSRNGKKLGEMTLKSPPIFDGLAAAHGRLWVSTQGGELVCLAARSTK